MIRVFLPIVIAGILLVGCATPPVMPVNTDATTSVYNEGCDIEPSTNKPQIQQLVISNLSVSNVTPDSARIVFDKNLSTQILGRLYKGENEVQLISANGNAVDFRGLSPETFYAAVLFSNDYPNYDKRIEFYTSSPVPVFPPTNSYYGYGGGWYYSYTPPVIITIWSGNINLKVE